MRFFRLFGGILLVVLAIGFIGSAFQAGYVAGTTGGAPGTGAVPWYGGWAYGWGFGGFHLLGTLFTIFIVIALLRFVFGLGHRDHGGTHGGHPWGHGGWGHGGFGPGGSSSDATDERTPFGGWDQRARDLHDEWHRRNDSPASSSQSTTSSGTATDRAAVDPPGGGR